MPYVTLAEQGRRPATDVLQDAVGNFFRNRQTDQQTQGLQQQQQQNAAAFPIEQQKRQADADTSTAEAAARPAFLALQQKGQELQNRISKVALDFASETNPTRKQSLEQQLQNLKVEADNLKATGQETIARTQGVKASTAATETATRASELNLADKVVTPGKLDPYGDSVINTTYKDTKTGEALKSEDTFQKGRGIPRAVYTQKFDPSSGTTIRTPHTVHQDPNNPDAMVMDDLEKDGGETGPPEPDILLRKAVDKFFNPQTGQRNNVAPQTSSERANLRKLATDKGQQEAYDIRFDALGDGQGTLAPRAAPAAAAAPVTADLDNQPKVTAGIGPGGTPTKTSTAAAEVKSPAPVPIKSGRAADAQASGGGSFKDVPIGQTFMVKGQQFKKTSDTTAEPVGGP